MEMLHTVGVLNNGQKLDYAFGLVIRDYKGLKNVGHGGSWAGFRAGISRFPDQKFSVICLANLSSVNPTDLCLKVADIYLADLIKEPAKTETEKPKPFLLSQKELEEKAGNYRAERFGQWIAVNVEKDKLKVALSGREFILTPTSPTMFMALEAPVPVTVEFPPAAAGKPAKAIFKGRGDATTFVKAAPVKPLTEADLASYAGTYVSEELLGAAYRFAVEKGALVVHFRSLEPTPLQAMAPDQFSGGFFVLDFVRGKGSRVTGFTLSLGRVAGLVFVRK
jgi:hypothetical protein